MIKNLRKRNKTEKIGLAVLLVCSLIFVSCAQKASGFQREAFLMDTFISVKVFGVEDENVLDEVFERLERIDKLFNSKSNTSDIGKINELAGVEPYVPEREVYELIDRSLKYAKMTDGAFNPAIGALVDLWGIRGRGEVAESIPGTFEIKEAVELCDYNEVELKNGSVFIKRKGVKIDLGAIVKGYATDEVCKILKKSGVKSAIIDLGGNIYAFGEKSGGKDWKVGIANPFTDAHEALLTVKGKDFSCVTSGDYERYIVYENVKYHHIFDTETGFPANRDYNSVSIISESSEVCDMLSTAIFVSGAEGVRFAEAFEDTGVVFVKDKEISVTEEAFEKLEQNQNVDGYKIIIIK